MDSGRFLLRDVCCIERVSRFEANFFGVLSYTQRALNHVEHTLGKG